MTRLSHFQRINPSAEMVMIDRMFNQEERAALSRDKRLALVDPGKKRQSKSRGELPPGFRDYGFAETVWSDLGVWNLKVDPEFWGEKNPELRAGYEYSEKVVLQNPNWNFTFS